MPQLEKLTYSTQFVRLRVFPINFYVSLYHDGLPKISRILKLRKQLISLGAEQSQSSVEQDMVLKECFNNSISYLYFGVSAASQWFHQMVKSFKINQLLQMNNSYMCSLGEISFSQVLEKHALDTLGSASYYQKTSLAPSCHTASALNQIVVLRGQSNAIVNINNAII